MWTDKFCKCYDSRSWCSGSTWAFCDQRASAPSKNCKINFPLRSDTGGEGWWLKDCLDWWMRKVWALMERQKKSPAVAWCNIKAETEKKGDRKGCSSDEGIRIRKQTKCFPFCKWCIYKENPIDCWKWWCCSSTLHVHQNKPSPCRSSEASSVPSSVSILFVLFSHCDLHAQALDLGPLAPSSLSPPTKIFNAFRTKHFLSQVIPMKWSADSVVTKSASATCTPLTANKCKMMTAAVCPFIYIHFPVWQMLVSMVALPLGVQDIECLHVSCLEQCVSPSLMAPLSLPESTECTSEFQCHHLYKIHI